MKAKFLTIAALFIMITVTANAAGQSKVLKITDVFGSTFCIPMKDDVIEETLAFDTKTVFSSIADHTKKEMIDIRPFVKQEKEVNEVHPITEILTK